MPQITPRLQPLADDLWVADHPLSVAGMALGTRTTIVRLADGSLWVHSPGALDDALVEEVRALGPVSCLVAPNLFHHLHLDEWAVAFPDARTFAAPGLADKRADLRIDETLTDEAPAAWQGQIGQVPLSGVPMVAEVVFFHLASRTLLLTDLCFNMQESDSLWTRIALRMSAAWQQFTPSRLFKSFIKDREALRDGIERILEWDFDRVIVTHGEVLESGGAEALRAAYAWLGVRQS